MSNGESDTKAEEERAAKEQLEEEQNDTEDTEEEETPAPAANPTPAATGGSTSMKPFNEGQVRVLVLLLVLLALEVIKSPVLQTFFKGVLNKPTGGTSLTTGG